NIVAEIDDNTFMKNQEATPKEQEIAIPYPIIQKLVTEFRADILENLSTSTREQIYAALLCSLVVLENKGAPRRREYLTLLMTIRDLSFKNYYNRRTQMVVLQTYKTSRKYGQYSFKVSQETARLLERIATFSTNTVFPRERNLTEQYENYFNIVVGKPLNANLVRYLCITHKHMNNEIQFEVDRRQLATLMGHSVAQQQDGTYIKRGLLDVYNENHRDDRDINGQDNSDNGNNGSLDFELDNDFELDDLESDDAPVIPTVQETHEMLQAPAVAPVVATRKRKARDEFSEAEKEQIEELWAKHRGDTVQMRNEAIDRDLELQKRTSHRICKGVQRISANRITDGQPLGNFEGIVLEDNILKEKGIQLRDG
ncbi:hypothetical protein HDU88_001991, partial [Geranomyces variabilis]